MYMINLHALTRVGVTDVQFLGPYRTRSIAEAYAQEIRLLWVIPPEKVTVEPLEYYYNPQNEVVNNLFALG
jgi:hypothetical protein